MPDAQIVSRPGRAARCAAMAIVVLVVAVITSCSGEDGPTVVLYVSADEHVAREVVAAFEAATGIHVRMVGDTEAKKTTGLVQRLAAEADHPQADVFWSSEIFMTIGLAESGALAPFSSSATEGWPENWRDPDGYWFAFAGRARVVVYAPDRMDPDEVPRTWTDLTNRRYGGRLVMADPRFGTTGGHLGAMRATWDRRAAPGYYSAFLLGLRDNEIRLLPGGNAGVVQAIIDGDADAGMTDTDDVWAARARGHRLELVYPAHSHEERPGNGTLLIPNTVALVRGAPHPAAAAQLIDFLLSEQTERLLAETTSRNVPLNPALAGAYPEYVVPDPLAVDYRRAAAARADAVREAMEVLANPSATAPASEDEAPVDAP